MSVLYSYLPTSTKSSSPYESLSLIVLSSCCLSVSTPKCHKQLAPSAAIISSSTTTCSPIHSPTFSSAVASNHPSAAAADSCPAFTTDTPQPYMPMSYTNQCHSTTRWCESQLRPARSSTWLQLRAHKRAIGICSKPRRTQFERIAHLHPLGSGRATMWLKMLTTVPFSVPLACEFSSCRGAKQLRAMTGTT